MISSKPLQALAAACCILTATSSRGAITITDSNFAVAPSYTSPTSDNIVSYDWTTSGDLYYESSTSSFNFGGLFDVNHGVTSTAVSGDADFSGASVVAIGDDVYFNTSDFTNQNIFKYGPLSGTPTASLVSTTANYGLYAHGGELLITGAPGFGPGQLFYTHLDASGNFVDNPVIDFGSGGNGSSGPLTFDAAGNLYYAPGFSDLSIYKWSASEVADAMANPGTDALSITGHLWEDYSSLYATVSGATSLLIDGNGDLLVTLTDFSAPSVLASFDIDGSGNYSGTHTTILQDTDLLGELRVLDGTVYVSSGNQIFTVVPEPSTSAIGFSMIGFVAVAVWRRRRSVLS